MMAVGFLMKLRVPFLANARGKERSRRYLESVGGFIFFASYRAYSSPARIILAPPSAFGVVHVGC